MAGVEGDGILRREWKGMTSYGYSTFLDGTRSISGQETISRDLRVGWQLAQCIGAVREMSASHNLCLACRQLVRQLLRIKISDSWVVSSE